MPYGHIKQYLDLIDEAEQKRIRITAQQERQIAKLYAEVAHDLGREATKHKKNSLGHRWLVDYGKALKRDSKSLYRQIQHTVESNMLATAKAVSGANSKFWGSIVPEVSDRFTDVFSTIPQRAVAELMNGGIYKDFTGLSERLWNYQGQFKQDIGYIINQGILAHRSAYDLAKDLEMYLDPKYKCPYEWSRLYPRSNKVVDYSAQRLARTSITHAYQMAMRRSTQDNPFVEKYQWLASNAATGTCELCRERNGKYFEKSSLPLDHPNGRCVVIPVIEKSYDEIAEEIRDWANGSKNPVLDKWLYPDADPKILEANRIMRKAKNNFPGNLQMNLHITPIGKLSSAEQAKKAIEKEFGKLITDDLVVTDERIQHIKQRHPEDYELFEKYGKSAINDPDLVIKDTNNNGTVFIVKKLEKTNLNVVVRMVLAEDNPEYKNSIMTFYRIRERNLEKLINKHSLIYIKE